MPEEDVIVNPDGHVPIYWYLKSKFYGERPGRFYGRDDAVLWLPRRLLKTGSVEPNHLTARGRHGLYLAFTNQSPEPVTTEVVFNPNVLPADAWSKDYVELPFGDTRAMILNFSPAATTAYVDLQADDEKFNEVTLTHWVGRKATTMRDGKYPFEFTVPLARDAKEFRFQTGGVTVDGHTTMSEIAALRK